MRLLQYADKLDNRLKQLKYTLSTAESCTGGLIAHTITDIPGCSVYFKGGIIAYSNRIKIKILGVDEDIIKRCGAVSGDTVRQMAAKTAVLFNTQTTIATSGIAGPGGSSPQKPVGLVWIAVFTPAGIVVNKNNFKGTRQQIKQQAACKSIEMLVMELDKLC